MLLRKHGMQGTQTRAVMEISASKLRTLVPVQNIFAILEAMLISTKEQQPNGKDPGQPCLVVEGVSSSFLRPLREDPQEATAAGRTTICSASELLLGEAVQTHTR